MNRPRDEVDVLDEPVSRGIWSSPDIVFTLLVVVLVWMVLIVMVGIQAQAQSRINASQSGFNRRTDPNDIRVEPEEVFCWEQHVYCQDVGVSPERFSPIVKMPPALPRSPAFGGGGGGGISAKPHTPHASFLLFGIDPFEVVVYGAECAAGEASGCADLSLALLGGESGSGVNVGQSGYPGTGGTAPCTSSAAGCGTGGGGGGGIGGVSCGNPPSCGPMPNVKRHTR